MVGEHPLLVPEALVVVALADPHPYSEMQELVVDDEIQTLLGDVQRVQGGRDGYDPEHRVAHSQGPHGPALRPGDVRVLEVFGIEKPGVQKPLGGIGKAAELPLGGALELPALLQEQRPLGQDELVRGDVLLEALRTVPSLPVQKEADHVVDHLLGGVLEVPGDDQTYPVLPNGSTIQGGTYVPEPVLDIPVLLRHQALLGFLGTTMSFCFCLIWMECSALTSLPLRSFLQWYIIVATVDGVGVNTWTCSGLVFRTLWQ